LEYPPQSKISPENQIPDIGSHLKPFLVDIFNWAFSTPKHVMKLHIRALEYYRYLAPNSSYCSFPVGF